MAFHYLVILEDLWQIYRRFRARGMNASALQFSSSGTLWGFGEQESSLAQASRNQKG